MAASRALSHKHTSVSWPTQVSASQGLPHSATRLPLPLPVTGSRVGQGAARLYFTTPIRRASWLNCRMATRKRGVSRALSSETPARAALTDSCAILKSPSRSWRAARHTGIRCQMLSFRTMIKLKSRSEKLCKSCR
ncbi:hypothetical protein O3P69_001993 [Scylla paramamosain]|uniref:Uncharacterized protein n=1 Tax=Scylla paramamosain TaxID=85552 RepID=A0AAW0V3Y9_SCYPA